MAEPRAWAQAGVSDREAEVLRLVGAHLSNAQTARRLVISVRTVESHVSSLLRKLDVVSRKELAQLVASYAEGSDLPGETPEAAADQAPSGEVWVTSTLRDLTAGSGLSFEPAAELDVPSLSHSVELDVVS